MADDRCPYFQAAYVTLRWTRPEAPPVLPVHGCRLSETMVVRLQSTPAGETVAEQLVIRPHGHAPRCMYGPDFDHIAPAICSVDRCADDCRPAFARLLEGLGLDPTPPEPEGP